MHSYLSHACYMTCHLAVLDSITLVIFSEVDKFRSSSLCSLLQPPTTFSLIHQNILLSTQFLSVKLFINFFSCC
jgi:hypothetical protein